MVQTVTQHDDEDPLEGDILDQVAYQYDGWGNLEEFVQDPDSEIGVSGRDEFSVGYTYGKATPSGSRPAVRRGTESRSDGTDLAFIYSSASNRLDHAVSRMTRIDHEGLVTVASYQYLGTSEVVGTLLDEINFYSRRYGGATGVYPGFDDHGRIIEDKWTKFANSAERNFYHVSLAYDANSNITLIEDHVHLSAPLVSSGIGRFDAAYTMDDLDRLIRAEEGHWGGSSISTRARDEDWREDQGPVSMLDHLGNWGRYRLDLDGNGDFTDGGDLDETRTHNIVNELTARDIDSDSGDDFTLTYDPAGNLTDDGDVYEYTYDPFGRLTQVIVRGSGPLTPFIVGNYRYNGLGYRTAQQYETDESLGLTGSDLWYWFCYDERWRIVATYRHEDEHSKESFVYHTAGFGGYGTSSYIDAVALRDRDFNTAWESAADGVREERVYLMQNWRSDISLVVTAGARVVEWVKYSAYGVPFGMPAGDSNANGINDALEEEHYAEAIDFSAWDARLDIDTDGVVDWDDEALRPFATMGRGVLSHVGNRKGYAGYEADPMLAGAKWHVRHRILDSELGRWTRRDPLGYVDGMSTYSFVRANPMARFDLAGLLSGITCPGRVVTSEYGHRSLPGGGGCGGGHSCDYVTFTTDCPSITLVSCSQFANNPSNCQSCSQLKGTFETKARNSCLGGGFGVAPFDVYNCDYPCVCMPSGAPSVVVINTITQSGVEYIGDCNYDVTFSITRTEHRRPGSCQEGGSGGSGRHNIRNVAIIESLF